MVILQIHEISQIIFEPKVMLCNPNIAQYILLNIFLSFQVTCLSACGEECVIATKVNTAVDK